MRWIPDKFDLWTSGATLSPSMAAYEPHSRLHTAERSAVLGPLLAACLAFPGFSNASELDAVSALAPATGHWPWIAAAAIAGLLGVVSFVSRRRIHAVVGS